MPMDQKIFDDTNYPIVMFGNEMFKELVKHNDEKSLKFYSMSVEKLYELLHEQTKKRVETIGVTVFTEGTPLSEIEKNCIHLANYCYFLWSQARKLRDGQR